MVKNTENILITSTNPIIEVVNLKIRNSLILGVVSGLLAGIPGRFLNYIEHQNSLNDMTYIGMAATLLVNKKEAKKTKGKLIGVIINNATLGLTGIATSYLLRLTGRSYAIPKGIGVAYTIGILSGVIPPQVGLVTKPKKKLTYLLSFIDHTILGGLCGYLVRKLGDDKLFNS